MDLSLLKQVNNSVRTQQAFYEAFDALTPSDETIETLPQVLVETAEAVMGKAFAQVGAGKNVAMDDANLIMGLYALGDPNMKGKAFQQIQTLGKGGTPLLVALQLAGDDAGVTNVLRQIGNEYVQASGQGVPFQIKNMMLGGNVLDQNQRAALSQRLQRAQSSFRNAAAKMQASQQKGGGVATPAPKTLATTSGAPATPVRPMNLAGGSGTTQATAAPGM